MKSFFNNQSMKENEMKNCIIVLYSSFSTFLVLSVTRMCLSAAGNVITHIPFPLNSLSSESKTVSWPAGSWELYRPI